jgi:hypothetical protein
MLHQVWKYKTIDGGCPKPRTRMDFGTRFSGGFAAANSIDRLARPGLDLRPPQSWRPDSYRARPGGPQSRMSLRRRESPKHKVRRRKSAGARAHWPAYRRHTARSSTALALRRGTRGGRRQPAASARPRQFHFARASSPGSPPPRFPPRQLRRGAAASARPRQFHFARASLPGSPLPRFPPRQPRRAGGAEEGRELEVRPALRC